MAVSFRPHTSEGDLSSADSNLSARGKRATRAQLVSFAFLLAATALLLLYFPPEQYTFYPQCPVHRYLGILCPGCGATRALAALLRGQVNEALRLNALTTLSLPIAIGWGIFSRRPLRLSQPSPAVLYTAFVVVSAFTLIRNL
jgi:hypothetical protein